MPISVGLVDRTEIVVASIGVGPDEVECFAVS
jgi:hypothetical protein